MSPQDRSEQINLIAQAFPLGPQGLVESDMDPDSEYRAQLKLYAQTQRAFFVGFQAVVLVLAVATLVALVVFVSRLTSGEDADLVLTVAAGLGTVVTGAASGFLQKLASSALRNYKDALERLRKAGIAN